MFYATFEEHNERMAQLVSIEFDAVTLSRYRLCLRYFKEMMSRKTKVADFPIKNLNGEMIRDFEAFLKIEKRVAQNTMIRYMKCLKKVVNLAIANGWITVNPFAGIKFHEKEVVREFLTMDELMTIYQKEFSLPRLALVRDVFIFSAFTGLAFIDVQQLAAEHIVQDNNGHYWIRKTRQKTNNMCNIPLLDIPLAILKKYENHPTCIKRGVLLPVPCNQNMNSYLKEIADVCGIQKHLSTHLARHSYATSVRLANGVSIENVAKMLGHSNIKMTQHYAKVLDSSILKDMMNVKSAIVNLG